MHRLKRLRTTFQKQPVYFVTACTHRRRQLLNNPESHQVFIEFCGNSPGRRVWIGKYVLMPDHLHLLVTMSADSSNLSKWVMSLKNTLSRQWRLIGIDGPYWQKGFFDHVIRSDQSHTEKWQYVRQNPVRAGLVEHPDQWPFAGEIHQL